MRLVRESALIEGAAVEHLRQFGDDQQGVAALRGPGNGLFPVTYPSVGEHNGSAGVGRAVGVAVESASADG